MDIRHLQLVQELAETGNLTRAAERLYLSPSALSHQLRGLEEELQIQLFVRSSRQMIATPAGERLLESAHRILGELDRAQADIAQLSQGRSGCLRLTTACYTCYHWLSPVLKEFRSAFPDVEIKILPEATYRALEELGNGNLDLVITSDIPDDPRFSHQALFEDTLVAVVAPKHPFGNLTEVHPEHFREETLLMYQVAEADSTLLQEFLFPAGMRPARILQLKLTEAVVEMAKAELGVAVLAQWAAQPYLDRGELIARPLRPPVRRAWSAVWLRHRDMPPYLATFVESASMALAMRIPAP